MAACTPAAPAAPAAPASAPAAPAAPTAPADPQAEINWPPHVELIVPAGPGGDTDFNARLMAEELTRYLPPNFVVTNVTGAGGAVGLRQVAESATDGSSAVVFHTAFVVGQHVGTIDFGFEAYEMAGIIAAHPGMVLLVRSELGINTMEELFSYSQANPGQLLLGVETGTVSFAVGTLLQQYGLDVTIVDAGPAAERVTMLLGGHVDIVGVVYGLVEDYIVSGMFVPLGVDGREDLYTPTGLIQSFRSQGFDVAVPFYYFMGFPAGTDPNLVAAVTEVIERTVHTNEEYQEAITMFVQTPTFFPPDEALAIYDEVYDILSRIEF